MIRAVSIVIVLAAPAAWADQILLVGGGALHGEVVAQSAGSIVVDVGPGRMTLPMSRVLRVVSQTSDLTVYRQRAAALSPEDVSGWIALARFAESRELLTQAREAYEHVAAIDPENGAANAGLGRAFVNGQWLDQDDANRARGLVSFEGAWVTPEQHAAALAERAEDARTRGLALEAAARAREAEARAQIAEAEARRAAAEASYAGDGGGYPFVYGGGYGIGAVGVDGYVGGYPPVYGGVYVGNPRPPRHGGGRHGANGDHGGRHGGGGQGDGGRGASGPPRPDGGRQSAPRSVAGLAPAARNR